MKKKLLIILLFFFNIIAFSQETKFKKVDYKVIEKEIKDKKSEYYYPKLMERFQKMDTTLTKEHMFHLYYGNTFQKDYTVYDFIVKDEAVKEIEQKEGSPSKEDFQILKKYYTNIYNTKPFVDIQNIEILGIIYSFEEDEATVKKILNIYYKLIDSILLTGDGEALETAIDVINTRTEYVLMDLFGVKVQQQSLNHNKGRSYDVLNGVTESNNEIDVYFDVTRLFEINNEKFKDFK